MESLDNLWVAEYSASQNAFNIDVLKNALASNMQMIAEKQNNDYLIFGIFKTPDEANAACDEMKQTQERAKDPEECLKQKE